VKASLILYSRFVEADYQWIFLPQELFDTRSDEVVFLSELYRRVVGPGDRRSQAQELDPVFFMCLGSGYALFRIGTTTYMDQHNRPVYALQGYWFSRSERVLARTDLAKFVEEPSLISAWKHAQFERSNASKLTTREITMNENSPDQFYSEIADGRSSIDKELPFDSKGRSELSELLLESTQGLPSFAFGLPKGLRGFKSLFNVVAFTDDAMPPLEIDRFVPAEPQPVPLNSQNSGGITGHEDAGRGSGSSGRNSKQSERAREAEVSIKLRKDRGMTYATFELVDIATREPLRTKATSGEVKILDVEDILKGEPELYRELEKIWSNFINSLVADGASLKGVVGKYWWNTRVAMNISTERVSLMERALRRIR